MKRIIILCFTVLFILSLIGCKSGTTAKSEVKAENTDVIIEDKNAELIALYGIDNTETESKTYTKTQSAASSKAKNSDSFDGIYFANKNSKIFHKSNCYCAAKIKDTNLYKTESRDELINSMYKPCGVCNP